ncbi:MAG: hypothetical protein AVDCRST_MAG26-1956, partial [uncultured Chloroflexia bacterium]
RHGDHPGFRRVWPGYDRPAGADRRAQVHELRWLADGGAGPIHARATRELAHQQGIPRDTPQPPGWPGQHLL